eukprot:3853495-Prymnesium_polylepis.1
MNVSDRVLGPRATRRVLDSPLDDAAPSTDRRHHTALVPGLYNVRARYFEEYRSSKGVESIRLTPHPQSRPQVGTRLEDGGRGRAAEAAGR